MYKLFFIKNCPKTYSNDQSMKDLKKYFLGWKFERIINAQRKPLDGSG